MLHIISVAHRAQVLSADTQQTEVQRSFAQLLRNTIRTIRPAFVAEEHCEEFLQELHESSIAKQVAGEFNIEHRFCDPNRAQRLSIGYKDRMTCRLESSLSDIRGLSSEEIQIRGDAIFIGRQFPVRERFWVERLQDSRNCAAVFICGEGHIKSDSFRRLLACKAIRCELVERGVGLTEEDRWFDEALGYLRKHPELMNE